MYRKRLLHGLQELQQVRALQCRRKLRGMRTCHTQNKYICATEENSVDRKPLGKRGESKCAGNGHCYCQSTVCA